MTRHHNLIPAALALVAACSVAHANTEHVVMQDGFRFVPSEITVEPGDTVRWMHSGGSHTVTSGTPCTPDGLYFDEPLDTQNPQTEWLVPDGLVGDVPYFCRPHCGIDMVGGISVVANACVADINGCGTVDFADLIIVLGSWGPCEGDCPADIDDSGAVDFGDILLLLANWGPCP